MDERGRDKVKSQRGRDTREKRDRETTEWGRKLRNIRDRQRGRQMEPERRESRSVSDAWARWMIIDPLCRQLERSVSDSTGQHHVERREEGQAEMFPLLFQRVTISLLHSSTLFVISFNIYEWKFWGATFDLNSCFHCFYYNNMRHLVSFKVKIFGKVFGHQFNFICESLSVKSVQQNHHFSFRIEILKLYNFTKTKTKTKQVTK